MKDDPFYGKSVIFKSFQIEHIIRIALSIIVCAIGIICTNSFYFDLGMTVYKIEDSFYAILMVLFGAYVGFLVLNIMLLRRGWKFS